MLGTPQSKIKHDSDLVPVRRRAKVLYKRYKDEKRKFDAKKVLEAFEMIKANLKGKIGEGQHKLLGRSRKERELDKHFNHQTKEIKKDKGLKRTLRRAMDGEKRVRLRGDKERVARPRHRAYRKHQKKKDRLKKKQRQQVDCLQGLQKLKGFLEIESKFPKAIPLLNRWVREYMNQDNRGHIFEVLQQLAQADYVIENSDARQEVIQVFEYAIGYFSSWFEEAESHQMLRWAWRVACVLACQCFTDDAFMLSRTIATLNEVLTMLEKNKDVLQDDQPDANSSEIGGMRGLPTPPGSPQGGDSPHEAPSPHAAPLGMPTPEGSPSVSDDEGGLMEFYATPSPSDDDGDDNDGEDVKDELKEELKSEFKEEFKEEKVEIKEEAGATVDIKPEAKQPRRIKKTVEIDSESDVKEEIIDSGGEDNVIDSEESVNLVDSEADSGSVYEDLGALSSGSGSDVEEIDFAFKVPSTPVILRWISDNFVARCLGTLFANRGPLWAQGKIDTFFQDVFYRRSVFKPQLQTQVEAWQARIKVLQKNGGRAVGEANSNPLEAHRPVVDSREMRTVIDSDSNSWAAKQTFDSRDKCGGSRVIR